MSQAMIRGAKGGGGTPHVPVESPDNLRSIAFFRILDLISEGEIGGLVNGQQSIFLDETPLTNPDGTSNFPKAHVEARVGTQDQTCITNFDAVENEIGINVELEYGTPWVRSITDTSLSSIRVTLGVPALSKANTSNGDIGGYRINYKIELSTDGGSFATVYDGAFIGKTTTKFQRSHKIGLPDATTGWQVKVTRLTANAGSSAIADTTLIDSYTEIVDAKMRYPNSALVAVMGDASQFTNIPQRAYEMFGRIVQVPSNYDVVTREYDGVWDGTFVPSWTDNPAWIYYDLVTHPRYGLGHLVTAAMIDKWELYRIAQYCDGMVDDGMGGLEPRFTCNIYLQSQADAYKLLNDLSTAFRGISYWANGTIVASADMPADPTYTYTDANVINGQFSYSASARKTRYTVALVSWNDPRNFYRTKVEYVEDADGIARYGIQQIEATAVGCVSQGQAQRVGRWMLLTARLETDTVTFSVGLDGTIVAPGQIIRVADSARAGRRQGGRIKSATTTAVVLDAAAYVGRGPTITVNMPDGTSQTRTVLAVKDPISWDATSITFDDAVYYFDGTVTGTFVEVTVTSPFTEAPAAEAVWTIEYDDLQAQTFRVLSVTEPKSETEISFTITALQHNASKFAAVDSGTVVQIPPISALTPVVPLGPATVTLTNATVISQGTARNMLSASWDAAPFAADHYELQWRQDDGEWVSRTVVGQSTDFGAVHEGTYSAQVRSFDSQGNASVWVAATPITIGDAGFRLSQTNLSMLRVGGIGSAWTGFSISYTSTSTSATISCTSGTLQDGANNPEYDASSIVVSGTPDTTVQYWLYYDDPTGMGGTIALGATTTYSDLSANQGRINVGDVAVTFPASGTGGGGGSPGGGGCPVVEAWVIRRTADGWEYARAGDVVVGDLLLLVSGRWGFVSHSRRVLQPCRRVAIAAGYALTCSTTAPLSLSTGGHVLAPDALGSTLIVRMACADAGEVIASEDAGRRWVQHITCENDSFWTGDDIACLFGHHNLKPVLEP